MASSNTQTRQIALQLVRTELTRLGGAIIRQQNNLLTISSIKTEKQFYVQVRGAAGTNPWLQLGKPLLQFQPFFILVSVDKKSRFFIFSPDEMTLELGQARKTHSPNDTTDGFGIDRAMPYENNWGTLPLP
jgi:hypothetical protein